jgi:hypothetical protein
MSSHIVIPATRSHILAMSTMLRAGDAAEIEAAGITPRRALWRSWRGSLVARAALVDGELAALWGVGGCPLGAVGQPWLLTAPPVERAKVAFLREARREVAQMLVLFPRLAGYVDARYEGAIWLLGAVGFTVGPSQPFGPHGAPFREYSTVRHMVETRKTA